MHWVITLILLIVFLAGLVRYQFWRPRRPAHWPRLLMYHSVSPDQEDGMNISPRRIERHLVVMKRLGYRFVTVSELRDLWEQGVREPMVALTFDDGFANNYQYLFPLLKKHHIKATIYLATQIEGIAALSQQQIKEMHASGLIEFGAHTCHHVNLLLMQDEQAKREIEQSVQAVREMVGQCRTFSYPYGRFDERHVAMVAATGCDTAVTVKKAIAEPSQRWLVLPRIGIHGKTDALQLYVALTRGKYRF